MAFMLLYLDGFGRRTALAAPGLDAAHARNSTRAGDGCAARSFSPIGEEDFKMATDTLPRRRMLGAAALAAPALALSPQAYQGNVGRALSARSAAMASPQAATPNKGGDRERAMHFIERAIYEGQAGIDFAHQRRGGGY